MHHQDPVNVLATRTDFEMKPSNATGKLNSTGNMSSQSNNAAQCGTTPIPEFKLPAEISSLHDLRSLHKCTEEIIRLRSQ